MAVQYHPIDHELNNNIMSCPPYRDFSFHLQDNGYQVERHKKAEANFPAKLHQMLSDPRVSNSIVWMVRIQLNYMSVLCTNSVIPLNVACCITSQF